MRHRLHAGLAAALLLAAAPAALAADVTERVSVNTAERQGNAESREESLSGNGRFVAFGSFATNLGVKTSDAQIYLRDRAAGTTTIVSLNNADKPFRNGGAGTPRLSRDARVIAFQTSERGPDNSAGLIYARDLRRGTTALVSAGRDGRPIAGVESLLYDISATGRYVLFDTFATLPNPTDPNPPAPVKGQDGLRLRDLQGRGTTILDPRGTNGSLSGNGRFVAYIRNSRDPGSVFNAVVLDRRTNKRVTASVAAGGAPADNGSSFPDISDNGSIVAFASDATNLVPGDTNGLTDVFVRDLKAKRTERVSVAAGGAQGNGLSTAPSLSADGRYVAFQSDATNLVAGDSNSATDLFVYDRKTRTTRRVDVSSAGAQANRGVVINSTISADGSTVGFDSDSTNLVPDDTNGARDVFVRGPRR